MKRKEGMERLVVNGKIVGKRDLSRQRLTYMKMPTTEILQNPADHQDVWKTRITIVLLGINLFSNVILFFPFDFTNTILFYVYTSFMLSQTAN